MFAGADMDLRRAIAVAGAIVAMTPSLQGQTPAAPPVLIESAAGADSFQRYCSPCHGPAGLGDGPVAAALKTRPANLTLLARRNDGAFPGERVRDYLAGVGRPLAAHGTTEMPIWGPLFGAFESNAHVRARLDNLVAYLESIQAPTTGAADRGRTLFNTHCAPCHGTSARGDG